MTRKDQSQFYDAAIRLSFGCVVELDTDGCIVSFDSYLERIFNEKTTAFIGKPWGEIFVPVDEQQTDFNPAKLDESSEHKPYKVLTQYNGSYYIEWKFMVLKRKNSSKDIAAILGAGIDVTRHIELKQQLLHADRLATVGQLAAGIAHEINGPLNNILGYAQLSAKQQDLPELVYQDLDNIIRLSLHAGEVVKKVMLFSRQVQPKYDQIDLNEIIKESLYFTEPLCRQNKISVECNLDENLPEIVGDFSQLRQVVVNMVVNSAQAISDSGGDIVITTKPRSSNRVEMRIQDTGKGMTPETLEKCFNPFFTTKDVDEGTGLGLSVVHGILKSHRAAINVESTVGQGSVFIVTFPLTPANGESDG